MSKRTENSVCSLKLAQYDGNGSIAIDPRDTLNDLIYERVWWVAEIEILAIAKSVRCHV